MKFSEYLLVILLILLCQHGYTRTIGLPDDECSTLWNRENLKKNSYLYKNLTDRLDQKSDYNKYYSTTKRDKCFKEWTVLIDMNGDDPILSANALMDIYDLESIGSSISVDIIVQVNTKDTTGIRRTHIFQSDEKWDRTKEKSYFENFSPASIKSPVIDILPEKALLESNLFEDFLSWGMQKYPSKHYMVVFWGHGEGWTNSNSFDTPGGIGINNEAGYKLSIPELKKSLKSVINYPLYDRKIDIFIADACLMQMIEVAYELKDVADYIITSPEIISDSGLPYKTILKYLVTHPKLDNIPSGGAGLDSAFSLAKRIPTFYKSSYSNGGYQKRGGTLNDKVILSTIRTGEMDLLLVPAMNSFSDAMLEYFAEDEWRKDLFFFNLQNHLKYQNISTDFYYFLAELTTISLKHLEIETYNVSRLKKAISVLQEAINRISIAYSFGNDYNFKPTKAISVWLPRTSEEYNRLKESYKASLLYKNLADYAKRHGQKSWIDFLDILYR